MSNSRVLDVRDAGQAWTVPVWRRIANRLRLDAPLGWLRSRKVSARYSLVVPCYNVEDYIDTFLESVFRQSIDLDRLEIITVDDGSTDGTAARIRAWMERFPGRIRYVHQRNQGISSARNTGMDLATGDWIGFPDADDFFSGGCLEQIDRETSRDRRGATLSLVACNVILFRDASMTADNMHPLRYKFQKARTVLPASDLKDYVHMQASSTWFRRSLLVRHSLRFDPLVAPTFEDGHLINKLLLLAPDTEVAFLGNAWYYYRKRQSGTSVVDQSRQSKAWYLDQFRYGYLDLLAFAKSVRGYVPRFIQRTVLYDVFWRFRALLDRPASDSVLNPREQEEFMGLLRATFSDIDVSTIETFELAGCREAHKVGLLSLMKDMHAPATNIVVRQYDAAKRLIQFSCYWPDLELPLTVRVNDSEAPVLHRSKRESTFLDRLFYVEHFFWVALEQGDEVSVELDGQLCPIYSQRANLGLAPSFRAISRKLKPRPVHPTLLPPAIRSVRHAAASPEARKRYGDCWLLMDRDDKADDNAEHFYRYLQSIGKADKAFFVLSPKSIDWARLEAEGFRLIPFDSMEHHVALLNAKFLISAHADNFIFWPLPSSQIGDLVKYRYVFLQHGVTKDDLSAWLNAKDMSLFVTATPREYESIASPESSYKFSEKEVVLTGFCRHDRLLTLTRTEESILIMPTWRVNRVGERADVGMRRELSSTFFDSEYARHWRSLLNSTRLHALAEQYGLRIEFCPHPNLTQQLQDFEPPDHVHTLNSLNESLQTRFAACAVLITDYSSVAFEAAYLEKPILYYQFDAGEIFSGDHVFRRGYFDYRGDGFGPVCETESELLGQLEATLAGREHPQYAARRRDTFPFRDGGCCQRIYESILALDQADRPGPRSVGTEHERPAAADHA